ncbi:hypothetical protein C474_18435 [Halogeometricum pallidum JCM 14848]|uniref:Uncharacterized protein n=1 Tax=Halogeometricum pallidum JCM 14848 TaxID=1227487 RepID=M0CTV7_HALPD|nr:hypothetical protein [Halogeometricum pallidum]ELZ26646.1 hypothetical protein C474_18435 [Halogeometricum pallidum JCM 14848]
MRTDPYETLPDELRPPSARRWAMRTVGVLLVAVGAVLLVGAGLWWTVSHTGLTVPSTEGEHHLSLALMGGVSLAHGAIAVAVVDSL